MSNEDPVSNIQYVVGHMASIRNVGVKVTRALADVIQQKLSRYLRVVEAKDLQIVLEFIGIKILIRTEIVLSKKHGGGKVVAYVVPERGDPVRLNLKYAFDEMGTVNKTLDMADFPVAYVNDLVNELTENGGFLIA